MSDDLTYNSAIQELEAILSELESSAVDVDQLSSRLSRATQLVKFCRERLTVVQHDVNEVLTDLQNSGEKNPDDSANSKSAADA